MSHVIAKKTVNALIEDAALGGIGKCAAEAAGLGASEKVFEQLRNLMGGLWVGGKATLRESSLAFRPNALNRAVHQSDSSLEIPLTEVSQVTVRSGFVTNIIEIATDDRRLSMRCYGAADFAGQIRRQVEVMKRCA